MKDFREGMAYCMLSGKEKMHLSACFGTGHTVQYLHSVYKKGYNLVTWLDLDHRVEERSLSPLGIYRSKPEDAKQDGQNLIDLMGVL